MRLTTTDIGDKLELKPLKEGNLLDIAFLLTFGGIAGTIFIPNVWLKILAAFCIFAGFICYIIYYFGKQGRDRYKYAPEWKRKFIQSWNDVFDNSNYGEYGSTVNYSEHFQLRNIIKMAFESGGYCVRRIHHVVIVEVKLDNGKKGIVGDIILFDESEERAIDKIMVENSISMGNVIKIRRFSALTEFL